jgi:hypothetical protein
MTDNHDHDEHGHGGSGHVGDGLSAHEMTAASPTEGSRSPRRATRGDRIRPAVHLGRLIGTRSQLSVKPGAEP